MFCADFIHFSLIAALRQRWDSAETAPLVHTNHWLTSNESEIFKKVIKEVYSINDSQMDNYENIYKSLTIDEGISFIKTINVGEKMELYNVKGTLENDVIFFINNIMVNRPTIYLSRHGQSQ